MINGSWFNILPPDPQKAGLSEHYSWLANLPSRVQRIANFGCSGSGEPFALLWTLDAKEIMVVERDAHFLGEFHNLVNKVRKGLPESLDGRVITEVCADMTNSIAGLPSGYYDLAYCEDVLYTLPSQVGALERGVSQMIRVVKPNGYVTAFESKFGARFDGNWPPNRISEPRDISYLFLSDELKKLEISSCPPYSYCYQKNSE